MAITYGSVCSGIEAASVAWEPLGWSAAWFAEIEPFAAAVLARRFPAVRNLGDMTRIAAEVLAGRVPAPDVLVGGTPCQAFSVAGLRAGLDDPRGFLTIKYVELANAIDFVRRRRGEPGTTVVWENVPGVLSDRQNAFGCFLGLLAGEACELEPEPCPPAGRSSRRWRWIAEAGRHAPRWPNAGCVYGPERSIAWRVMDAKYFGVAQRRRRLFVVAVPRGARLDPAALLFESEGPRRDCPPRWPEKQPFHPTLTAQGGGALDDREAYVLESAGVRRTTVIEWERCQGFPDNWTRIPWKGRPAAECPDGPRYKAIGNSMAVPVMRWIGRRIAKHLEAVRRTA